jgi:mannan endo-1,4-beta-mannosidase
LNTSYVASNVDAAKTQVRASGQRLLYEEFGATGDGKQSQVQSITDLLVKVSIACALLHLW